MKQVTWTGPVPTECQLCERPVPLAFVDASITIEGRSTWACVCIPCHRIYGCGFGIGRGQLYRRQEDGTWLKSSPD